MKLEFTPDAIHDIDNIRRYIATILKNRPAATRIKKMLVANCLHLKKHPHMGMSVAARTNIDSELRYVICESWLIFYRISADTVQIVNVIDGRSDYIKLLSME